MSAKGPSASVSLQVYRDGKTFDRTVKLGERPGQQQQASTEAPSGETGIDWLGIQYQDLSAGVRSGHGVPDNVEGVLVTTVAPTSPLYEQAVRPGSIITEVNGHEVKSVADFERAVKGAKSKSYLRFYVMSFGRGQRLQPFFAVVQAP